MQKVLAAIDKIIQKIPAHVQDIIKKASLAVFLLFSLLAILKGIAMGADDLGPPGVQLIQRNSDLFINDQLREENRKKIQIIEEVVLESRDSDDYLPPSYMQMASPKQGKILSTEESIEVGSDFLRRKRSLPLLEPDEESNSPVEQVKVEKINQPVSSGERKKELRLLPDNMDKEPSDNKRPAEDLPLMEPES